MVWLADDREEKAKESAANRAPLGLQGTENSRAANLISHAADRVDQRTVEAGIYFFP